MVRTPPHFVLVNANRCFVEEQGLPRWEWILGFCGSQEEHTLIRTHLSSFYLCGGIKLMGIILTVFRCFFLSIFVLWNLVHRCLSFPDIEAVAEFSFLTQNEVFELLQKILWESVNACLFFLRKFGHFYIKTIEKLLMCSLKWYSK